MGNKWREYKELRHHNSLHPHYIQFAFFYCIVNEYGQQYQRQIDATKGKISSFKGEGKNKDNDQTTKQLEKLNDAFSKGVGGISSIASGLQQMGVEIPKELQSTLNVLQGISTIMGGILALVTLINGKQTAQTVMAGIPFFAHGGIVPHAANGYYVPGNSYSGDNTMIMANAGELVLSRSQQGAIAGALEDGAGRSVHVTGHLEGETIVLAADRYGRRTGKGELAFWK